MDEGIRGIRILWRCECPVSRSFLFVVGFESVASLCCDDELGRCGPRRALHRRSSRFAISFAELKRSDRDGSFRRPGRRRARLTDGRLCLPESPVAFGNRPRQSGSSSITRRARERAGHARECERCQGLLRPARQDGAAGPATRDVADRVVHMRAGAGRRRCLMAGRRAGCCRPRKRPRPS